VTENALWPREGTAHPDYPPIFLQDTPLLHDSRRPVKEDCGLKAKRRGRIAHGKEIWKQRNVKRYGSIELDQGAHVRVLGLW
jgi:hypothetical protein